MRAVTKNDGFTLLEVVISIAALALISVFILQMFIASSNLNERARNADIALAAAITEIDNFKGSGSFSEYMDDTKAYAVNNGDGTELYFYYDEDWNFTEADGGAPPSRGYYLRLLITPETLLEASEDGALYGELYSVQAEVEEMREGEENRRLAFLSAKKYFSNDFKAAMQL